jgi:hypothetical protein
VNPDSQPDHEEPEPQTVSEQVADLERELRETQERLAAAQGVAHELEETVKVQRSALVQEKRFLTLAKERIELLEKRPGRAIDVEKISPEAWQAFSEVRDERARQEAKWGQQNHDPLYYGAILAEEAGEAAKETVEVRALLNSGERQQTEFRLAALRKELIQTAAVAIGFVECLDRGTWKWGE